MPRGSRIRIGPAPAYPASPIDLIPDILPGIGYADDVIVVAVVLRSAVWHAGVEAVRGHRPGTEEGPAALLRLTRLDRASL